MTDNLADAYSPGDDVGDDGAVGCDDLLRLKSCGRIRRVDARVIAHDQISGVCELGHVGYVGEVCSRVGEGAYEGKKGDCGSNERNPFGCSRGFQGTLMLVHDGITR